MLSSLVFPLFYSDRYKALLPEKENGKVFRMGELTHYYEFLYPNSDLDLLRFDLGEDSSVCELGEVVLWLERRKFVSFKEEDDCERHLKALEAELATLRFQSKQAEATLILAQAALLSLREAVSEEWIAYFFSTLEGQGPIVDSDKKKARTSWRSFVKSEWNFRRCLSARKAAGWGEPFDTIDSEGEMKSSSLRTEAWVAYERVGEIKKQVNAIFKQAKALFNRKSGFKGSSGSNEGSDFNVQNNSET